MWKKLAALPASVALLYGVVYIYAQVPAQEKPLGYNATVREMRGENEATFFQQSVNFIDPSGEWKKIDIRPRVIGGEFRVSDAPYGLRVPLLADAPVSFTANARYSIKEGQVRDEPSLEVSHVFPTALPVSGIIQGSTVVYPAALGNADIIVQPDQEDVDFLIRWNSDPLCTGNLEIPIELTLPTVPKKRDRSNVSGSETDITQGAFTGRSDHRGVGLKKARIWDSSNVKQGVQMVGRWNGTKLFFKKIIPCSFFTGASYPVFSDDTLTAYPDPNPESTSHDAILDFSTQPTNNVFSVIRDAVAATVADDTVTDDRITSIIHGSVSNTFRRMVKALYGFDTSSLGAGATVTACTFTVTGSGRNDVTSTEEVILDSPGAAPASATATTTTDYAATNWDGVDQATAQIAIGSWSTTGANTYTCDSDGIATVSKTGISWFGLRQSSDFNNVAPTWSTGADENVQGKYADAAGTATDPTLVVTYTPGATGAKKIIIIIRNTLEDLIPFAFARG